MGLNTPENSKRLAVSNHSSWILKALDDGWSEESIWEDQVSGVRNDPKLKVDHRLKIFSNPVRAWGRGGGA